MAEKLEIHVLKIKGTHIRLEFESEDVASSGSDPSCVKVFQGHHLLATIEANLGQRIDTDGGIPCVIFEVDKSFTRNKHVWMDVE